MRFQDRRGDGWCDDDRLYKRAARVDEAISKGTGEAHVSFKWLVNSVWRHGSKYAHGSAIALADQVSQTGGVVTIQRKYTREEAAEIMSSANFALYLIVLLVDLRLGGKNADAIKRMFTEWGGGTEEDLAPSAQ